MALRTAAEYVASLRDGRSVFYRGTRVEDVTTHPVLRVAIDHAAIDYRMAEDPRWHDLAVVDGHSRYFHVPRSADDLLARSHLIEEATREGATLVVLIKEIGTDALFALSVQAARLGDPYTERVRRYFARCRENDVAMAVAQTDAKGDRALAPSEQPDRDAYVRVVERRSDGIVVRGTKCHTSVSVNANELIVLPTRQLAAADADYAVAFAVPVATPGLTLVASPHLETEGRHPELYPISARHKMLETTTLFDDVFVPWERVFLCGEWQEAGPLARGFVEFHRFTAVSYKLPLVDALVGAAVEVAAMNGILKAGHVREKLVWLATYAETLRALLHHAAERCRTVPPGIAVPDPLLVNVAKLHFASGFHTALMHVQDLAGGLTVTAPSPEDLAHPELGPRLTRAYAGAGGVGGAQRLRLMWLISELTANDFAGYQAVLAVHAEGSLEAEKLTILREYDAEPARRFARRLAGLPQQ
jgi:aromatic ring hydroxylase